MIIVRFQGGLGNQMFQYCCMQYMKKYSVDVLADISEFNGYSYHNGLEILDIFDVKVEIAPLKYRIHFLKATQFSHKTRIGVHINGIIRRIAMAVESFFGKQRNYITSSELMQLSDTKIKEMMEQYKVIYLDGFYQYKQIYDCYDPCTVFKFKDTIVEKCKDILAKYQDFETCSIHVRCGDYIGTNNDYLGIHYYKKAVSIINSKIDNVLFLVFSDDKKEAERRLGHLSSLIFMDDDYSDNSGCDMYLMSHCKHNIIANSTFSFWGAKLNDNDNKLVIAPRYFKEGVEFIHEGDEDWILI